MPEHIFSGGCIDCTQQERHGVDFCFDCQHFEEDRDKPNLHDSQAYLKKIREEVKFRRQNGTTPGAIDTREILRNPARRRELFIELCREQVWQNTRTWVTYEEAAKVYDELLAKQELRKAK